MKNYGTGKCKECKKPLVKRAVNHELCGSKKDKTGCAYKLKILRSEKYRLTNKDKIHEQYLKYKLIRKPYNKNVQRNISYRNNFGISLDDYNKLFNSQNGLCAICGKEETNGKNLSVDHNHKTGKVRGLLCNNCNRSIGLLKEDIGVLQNSINYLIQHGQCNKT